jgi:D-amino-acid dehydrogenase
LRAFGDQIVGGTYTPSTKAATPACSPRQLARRCAERGVQFMYGHDVLRLQASGGTLWIHVGGARPRAGRTEQVLRGGAVVAACGSYTAPLLRRVGVDLPIYPGKGYSATFDMLRPEAAPSVSVLDDEVKMRHEPPGQHPARGWHHRAQWLRPVAGHAAGPRPLPHAGAARGAGVPGRVRHPQREPKAATPASGPGLRPATPTNIPFIGQTRVRGLWVNAGHGTLGWTHGAGSGKAMAELIGGRVPAIGFGFLGADRVPQRPRAAATIAA